MPRWTCEHATDTPHNERGSPIDNEATVDIRLHPRPVLPPYTQFYMNPVSQPPQWLWEITHTHPLNGPLFRTTRVSRYQKVKRIWILQKQEKVSGSGISRAICKSAPRSRQRQSTKDCDRLLLQNFHMAICIPMPATVIIGFQPVFSEQLQAEERSLPLSQ